MYTNSTAQVRKQGQQRHLHPLGDMAHPPQENWNQSMPALGFSKANTKIFCFLPSEKQAHFLAQSISAESRGKSNTYLSVSWTISLPPLPWYSQLDLQTLAIKGSVYTAKALVGAGERLRSPMLLLNSS